MSAPVAFLGVLTLLAACAGDSFQEGDKAAASGQAGSAGQPGGQAGSGAGAGTAGAAGAESAGAGGETMGGSGGTAGAGGETGGSSGSSAGSSGSSAAGGAPAGAAGSPAGAGGAPAGAAGAAGKPPEGGQGGKGGKAGNAGSAGKAGSGGGPPGPDCAVGSYTLQLVRDALAPGSCPSDSGLLTSTTADVQYNGSELVTVVVFGDVGLGPENKAICPAQPVGCGMTAVCTLPDKASAQVAWTLTGDAASGSMDRTLPSGCTARFSLTGTRKPFLPPRATLKGMSSSTVSCPCGAQVATWEGETEAHCARCKRRLRVPLREGARHPAPADPVFAGPYDDEGERGFFYRG